MLSEPNIHNRAVRVSLIPCQHFEVHVLKFILVSLFIFSSQESMAEVFFETFGTEAMYTAKRAVLTAISCT